MKTAIVFLSIIIVALTAKVIGLTYSIKAHHCLPIIWRKPYPTIDPTNIVSISTNRIALSNSWPVCAHTGTLHDLTNDLYFKLDISHWCDGTSLDVCLICKQALAVVYRGEMTYSHWPVSNGAPVDPFKTAEQKKADRDKVYQTYRERMDEIYEVNRIATSNFVWRAYNATNSIIVVSNVFKGADGWRRLQQRNDTNRFLVVTQCEFQAE